MDKDTAFFRIFAEDRLHLGNLSKLIALDLHYLCIEKDQ